MLRKTKTLVAFKLLRVKVTCRKCKNVESYSEGLRAEVFEPPSRKYLTKQKLEELLRLYPEAPRRIQTISREVDACPQCFEEREGFPYPIGIKLTLGGESPKEREKKKKRQKEAEELLDSLFNAS